MEPPPEAQLADVLKGALALSADDQAQLCSVLLRITALPASPLDVVPPSAEHATDQAAHEQQAVENWLQQVQREPVWTQLLLLDDALAGIDSEEEASALRAARTQLLQANPPIAVRRAVVDLASQHPIGVCVGAVGLAVALFGLGRVLLRLLF
jgi:hypothetical protein